MHACLLFWLHACLVALMNNRLEEEIDSSIKKSNPYAASGSMDRATLTFPNIAISFVGVARDCPTHWYEAVLPHVSVPSFHVIGSFGLTNVIIGMIVDAESWFGEDRDCGHFSSFGGFHRTQRVQISRLLSEFNFFDPVMSLFVSFKVFYCSLWLFGKYHFEVFQPLWWLPSNTACSK